MAEDDDFRLLFDESPRPMWVMDRETLRFLEVNEATCATYGWSREELLAMTVRDIRPPDEIPRLQRAMAEMTRERQTLIRSSRHMHKDGRTLEVQLDIRRLKFRGRDASIVVVTDITGVGEVERRFRMLIEHSADGAALVDEKGIIRYMSPGAERMLGLAPGERVGESAADDTHPDDVKLLAPAPPGATGTYIVRVRHHGTGAWRWIEATTTNMVGDLSVRAYVSSFRDVTKRIEAEQSLRRSETNFRTLIERTPTLVIVHREGIIRYVNPAIASALGYDSADELVGKPIIDLVHPDDRAAVRARMEHTARKGGGAPGPARMMRRDGGYIETEGEGVLLDFDGKPSNVVLGRDVTERNEMFARMAVADRLVSVGTLAAGVAHEINNPISWVVSNLAVIADELPALVRGESRLSLAEIETLVADAREGTARVSAIVRDLRALSRSDEETTAPVDVAAVLVSSVKMATNEARHRARLVTSIDPALPRVRGNASRLGQVFLNLLVNAAQAIAEGRAAENEIRVRAHARNGSVVVEVEDTGAGIPPSVLGRIFDPFFTTKPIGVGTGLGLSISHEIVRSLGGTIAVESVPGSGSTFRVTLPAAGGVTATAPDSGDMPVTAGARVLMIDDEPGMGRSTRILMARDYDIVPVTRARDALARIERGERFDAIVCDLMMPEMGGLEFYEQLSRSAPEQASRVVFLTGGAFTAQAREFLARTQQPHVEKPFSEGTLRAAIERIRRAEPSNGASERVVS